MPVEEQVSGKPLQAKKDSRNLHQGSNIHATFWARRFLFVSEFDIIHTIHFSKLLSDN